MQHGRGYVGLTDAGANAEIVFPHVDTCLALALILDNNRLIGGHVSTQWPGMPHEDHHFCIERIIALMDANLEQAGGKIVRLILAGHGNWWHANFNTEVGTAMAHWDDVPYFGVVTDNNAPQGCDIHVHPDSLAIKNLNTNATRTWTSLELAQTTYKTNAF
jgi:hypothetical protein